MEVKRIIPQTVEFYSVNDGFICDINEYEFNNIKIELKKNNEEGYFCKFNGEKVFFSKNGTFHKPKGMFDLFDDQLDILLDL